MWRPLLYTLVAQNMITLWYNNKEISKEACTMLDEKKIIIIDENENEIEMEILFTFTDDNRGKNYVLYIDPSNETGEVLVSSYSEEGELEDITDEAEWEMIEEVFNAFVIEEEDGEEA